MTLQIKNDEKQCLKCLKVKKKSNNFFNSYHKWHSDGKMPYCKRCLLDYFDEDNVATLKDILRMVDKPFNYEWLEKAKEDTRETLGVYFILVNLNNKYDKYSDSVFEYGDTKNIGDDEKHVKDGGFRPEDIEQVELTKEQMEYLIDFWGQGYTKDDYEFLQREFERLTNAYESESSYAMEILFQEAAHQRLTIKRKRENNESVDKELKTFQDLLGSANIKPAQETGANSAEQATFGTLIKRFENEKPIPEPDEEWKDVDNIRKYVSVWFLGHLSKMLGIKNDYSPMYEEAIKEYTVEPPANDRDG